MRVSRVFHGGGNAGEIEGRWVSRGQRASRDGHRAPLGIDVVKWS